MSLARKRREALEAGLGRGDRIKIVILVGGLVVVVLVFVVLTLWSLGKSDGESEGTSRETRPADNRPVDNEPASVVEMDTDGRIRARVAPDTSDVLGEETPVDLARLEHVQDDSDDAQRVIEVEALDYLLNHVHNVASIRRKVSGFERVDSTYLVAAPSRYRGLAVEFKGRLLEGKMVAYPDHVRDVEEIYRGWLEILPREGEPEGPRPVVSITYAGKPEFEAGRIVRVQGFFLKVWRKIPPGHETEMPTAHVVVRRFIESFDVVTQTTLDPFWFTVRDGSNLDEQPFWLLLNHLRHLTPETYRTRKSEGAYETVGLPPTGEPFPEAVPENVITDFEERGMMMADNHQLYRGRLVRVTGVLYKADPVVPPDNPGGIERYWDCWLAQDRYLLPIAAPFPMDRYGVSERDRVHVEGYLYKRRSWDNLRGERLRAPFLLVTDITKVPEGSSPLDHLPLALSIVGAIFVTVLLVMLFLDRKASRRHEERRLKIRRSQERRADAASDASDAGGLEPEEDDGA